MTSPSPPRSLTRAAFVGAAWLGALNSLGGLLVFGLTGYLNHALPQAPVEMALWVCVFALLLLASLVFEAGLTGALMQRKDLEAATVAAVARLQLLLGFAGMAAMWLVATPLARLARDLPEDRLAALVRLAAPIVLIIAAGSPQKALLQRDLRFRAVASIESGSTLLFVVLGALLAPRWGAEGLVLATYGRHGLETAFYWAFGGLRALASRGGGAQVGATVRYGSALALQGIVNSAVRQADTFVVMALLPGALVGVYRQVQLFVTLPFTRMLVYANRAAFPTFARVQDDPERLRRGFVTLQRTTALLAFPALAGLAAVAPRLLFLFLGPQYEAELPDAIACLRLLAAGGAAFTLAYGMSPVLNATGHAGRLLWRQVAHGAFVFGLMAAGAAWSLPGISAGRSLAGLITLVLFADLARRCLGLPLREAWRSVREAVVASLGTCAVALLVGRLADVFLPASSPETASPSATLAAAVLVAQSALGAAAYLVLLRALGVRPLAELKRVRG